MEILRSGIIDPISEDLKENEITIPRKRYCLTVSELKNELAKKDVTLSYSNLYFHVDHLEDDNLIRAVETLRKGKKFVTYYGRNAKLFLTKPREGLHSTENFVNNGELENILLKLDPDLDTMQIKRLIANLQNLFAKEKNVIEEWLAKREKLLLQFSINFNNLWSFLSIVYRYSVTVGETFIQLRKSLKFHRDYKKTQIGNKSETISSGLIDLSKDMYDHWDRIPVIKMYPSINFTRNFDAEGKNYNGGIIRSHISNLFKEGLQDKIGTKRVFTAKEVLDNFNSKKFKDLKGEIIILKKSNLYHYLQKLEDDGFILEVGYTKTGRKHVTYFGRAARVFGVIAYDGKALYPIIKGPEFLQLIQQVEENRSIDEVILSSYRQEIDSINYFDDQDVANWIEFNEDIIHTPDLNYEELAIFMAMLQRFDENVFSGLNKFANLLSIQQADQAN